MQPKNRYTLALITGASSGIGRSLALKLADQGVSLILTGRNQTALSQLATYLRPKIPNISFLQADITKEHELEKVLQEIYKSSPDLIINSAGMGLYGEALSYPTSKQLEILNINAKALTVITLEAARTLQSKNKKGTILNISSVAGEFAFPSFALYAATKAYVTNLSKSLDEELKPSKIRVLCALPGRVATQFGKRAGRTKEKKISSLVMTQEEAANHLLYQLEKEIPTYIFNWKYRWMHRLSYLIPQVLLKDKLKKEIDTRIEKRAFLPINDSVDLFR
jgi:short-subunit dehydrogenase